MNDLTPLELEAINTVTINTVIEECQAGDPGAAKLPAATSPKKP